MAAPFKPTTVTLAVPKVHSETDGSFLWRVRGHYTDIVVVAGTPPRYRGATQTEVTT